MPRELQLSDLKVEPPKKQAFTICTDPLFPKQHSLNCWSGKRGSGKSCACANQIRIAKERGYYHRVWLICGTYESNREIWQGIAGIDDDDVIKPEKNAFAEAVRRLEEEKKQWDVYQSQMKHWKENNKLETKETQFFKKIDDTSREMNFFGKLAQKPVSLDLSKPKWPYKGKPCPPRCCVVLDDCMGEPIVCLPSAGLTKWLIAHRHWAGGLGISVHMLLQSYASRESLSRPIREQVTVLCLFHMSQIEQIKKVWTEADLPGFSFDAFLAMFRYATEEPHSFLMIDFSPKEEYMRYRKNMDEFIDPEPYIKMFPLK